MARTLKRATFVHPCTKRIPAKLKRLKKAHLFSEAEVEEYDGTKQVPVELDEVVARLGEFLDGLRPDQVVSVSEWQKYHDRGGWHTEFNVLYWSEA